MNERRAVCVILAAGASSRMGAQKLLLPLGGRTLLEHALDAAAGRPTVVVVSPALAGEVPAAEGWRVVLNEHPDRGMSHSLALADAAVHDRGVPLVVLLADTPGVDAGLVERVVAALDAGADVAYPVRNGVGGHPVAFGPRARAMIAALPAGDTLRRLRDHPELTRATIAVSGPEPFVDVDTRADYERLSGAR